MPSTSETGHAINVANFNVLITYSEGYGVVFNPSRDTIKIIAMKALSKSAADANEAVNAAKVPYSKAVAARDVAFDPLSKFITRVINSLKVSGVTQQAIDNALTHSRKLQGRRSTPKLTGEQKAALKSEGKEANESSSSQLGFDDRLDNLDKLIKMLLGTPEYAPNETDLKTASLTAMYTDLKAKNDAAVATAAPLSNARIARNEILYKKDTGLVATALNAKAYIKSVYGASSPQYKQVSGIKFTTLK